MGGSVMQLVAVGAQDIPLIGNPQMTFFKSVFKRHTNFAIESIPLSFNEAPNFQKKVSCLIDKKGDLVSDVMVEVKLPALSEGISWANGVGHHMIEKVELEIGGVLVDTIQGQFLDVYTDLSIGNSLREGYYRMVGKHNVFTRYSQSDKLTLYIPLPFWFCKDYGRALPLIALQYHDVVVNVFFREFSRLWYSGTSMSSVPTKQEITNAQLYCDYIFLDTKERRYFATHDHAYLIEQHQHTMENPVQANNNISKAYLHFNLPVKEMIWVYQADDVSLTNDWTNYSYTLENDQDPPKQQEPIIEVDFQINGYPRFEPREGTYFRLVQPYKHHRRSSANFIYCYSFALEPEKAQPSGTMDFSWINSAVLNFKHPNDILAGKISVYAINYNYLQIRKGMANLVYQS